MRRMSVHVGDLHAQLILCNPIMLMVDIDDDAPSSVSGAMLSLVASK